jgi:hypothetical protein
MGWIVFYIPETGSLMDDTDENVARRLNKWLLTSIKDQMRNTTDKSNQQTLKKLIDMLGDETTTKTEIFKKVIDELRLQNKFPVLFAIDQWNAIFEKENHILSQFRFLKTMKPEYGQIIVAVSSSFHPLDLKEQRYFRDADWETCSLDLPLYTTDEFTQILTFKQRIGHLPPLNEQEMEKLKNETGNVPRMLFFFTQIYNGRKNDAPKFDQLLYDLKKNATNYYKKLIQQIFSKDSSAQDKFPQIYDFLALILLDRCRNVNLPQRWKISGLFLERKTNDGTECKPICGAVYSAINEYIPKQEDYLKTFLLLGGDKGRAFEIWIYAKLQKISQLTNVPITLSPCDLHGDQISHLQIKLEVNRIIKQERKEPLKEIKPGDAIICYEYYPVVDFVLLTREQKKLLFIQVSVSPYSKHPKKFTDLFKSRSELGASSIVEYYVNRVKDIDNEKLNKWREAAASIEINDEGEIKVKDNDNIEQIRRRTKLLWKGYDIHYLYITLSDDEMGKTAKDSWHPVCLIHRPNLAAFGDDFVSIFPK